MDKTKASDPFKALPQLAVQRILESVFAHCSGGISEQLQVLVQVAGVSRAARVATIRNAHSLLHFTTAESVCASIQELSPIRSVALAPTDVDTSCAKVHVPSRLASAFVHRERCATGALRFSFCTRHRDRLLSACVPSKHARSVDIISAIDNAAIARLKICPSRQSFVAVPLVAHNASAWYELKRWFPACADAISREQSASSNALSALQQQLHQGQEPATTATQGVSVNAQRKWRQGPHTLHFADDRLQCAQEMNNNSFRLQQRQCTVHHSHRLNGTADGVNDEAYSIPTYSSDDEGTNDDDDDSHLYLNNLSCSCLDERSNERVAHERMASSEEGHKKVAPDIIKGMFQKMHVALPCTLCNG